MEERELFSEESCDGDIFKDEFHQDKVFTGISYESKRIVAKEFYRCRFQSCKFARSEFVDCQFQDCAFAGCDLSLIKINQSGFMTVCFVDSKLLGINWTNLRGPPNVSFETCVLSSCVFFGVALTRTSIRDCTVKDADFAEANLTLTDFQGCELAGTRFGNTNLSQCDFSGARNYQIDPRHNKFKKTKFSLPDAVSLLSAFDIVLK
ncbi:MAG TPA: pentapeptide repeat-containing protein [Chthoniobacterales bacterium]|nr:pentapeptide repeat-containing protein [Chthoniobacterales bacterium]